MSTVLAALADKLLGGVDVAWTAFQFVVANALARMHIAGKSDAGAMVAGCVVHLINEGSRVTRSTPWGR